jgi:hypothetical protein
MTDYLTIARLALAAPQQPPTGSSGFVSPPEERADVQVLPANYGTPTIPDKTEDCVDVDKADDRDEWGFPVVPESELSPVQQRWLGHVEAIRKRLGIDPALRPRTGAAPRGTCNRCGGTAYRDSPIHGGRSTRRDCARCGRMISFPIWYRKPQL